MLESGSNPNAPAAKIRINAQVSNLLFAEAGPVTVNPARFRSDEARMQVMARIAGILGDLEAAVRRELGADQIPPKTRPPRDNTSDRAGHD